MPFKHAGFHNISRGVGFQFAVHSRHFHRFIHRARLCGNHFYHVRFYGAFRRDFQRAFIDFIQIHRMSVLFGIGIFASFEKRFSLLGNKFAVDEHLVHHALFQIGNQHHIRAFRRRNRTELRRQPEALGGVYGNHLNRRYGVESLFHRAPHQMIEMSAAYQRVRMRIVRNKARETAFHAMFRYRLAHFFQIVPGRSFAKLHVHASAHLFQRGLLRRGFVAAGNSRGDIRVHHRARFRNRKMSRNRLSRFQRFAHDVVRVFIRIDDAGEIHHFSEPRAFLPLHRFRNVRGVNFGTRIFEAGHRGHAGRRRQHGFQRRRFRVFQHTFHAVKPFHVAYFVRVEKDAARSVRNPRPRILSRRQHGRFDVHVPVHKRRSQIFARSVDDFRIFAHRSGNVADRGDSAHRYGYVVPFENLMRAYVDQFCVFDDKVGFFSAERYGRKLAGAFPKRKFTERVYHGCLRSKIE